MPNCFRTIIATTHTPGEIRHFPSRTSVLYILVVTRVFKQNVPHILVLAMFFKTNHTPYTIVNNFYTNIVTIFHYKNILMNSTALCWYVFKIACILRWSINRYLLKFWEDRISRATSFNFVIFWCIQTMFSNKCK